MEILVAFVVAIAGFVSVSAHPTPLNEVPSAYQRCPAIKANMLNVHFVPHTHDDVGWLKTPDEYYYGDKNNIQKAGVQYILDTVIEELEANPDRRFIYVEMSFFYKWWNSRDDSVHQRVVNLVNSGQLEFIGGGWSMSDEAANYYVELIDEMTRGFRFLNDTFGPVAVPKVAWQIDPFGHSRETASLFAQMGFDGLFFGRLDYEDKNNRLSTQTMELVWNASANLGIESQLFTGALYNGYGTPPGFCFDIECNDIPIKDNPNLKDYNVNQRVDEFITRLQEQEIGYATNNIIITMGGDFQFQDARTNFVNMDKLIQHVNERQATGSMINAFYSTPSCYLYALNQANKVWTVKTDDFMPYASDDHTFWTGYFTSRAAFKGLAKYTNNILQIAKQLTTFGNVGSVNEENLDTLKRFQGDAQHHDSITGTEKQAVTYDYTESLAIGITTATAAINSALSKIVPNGASFPPAQQLCNYLNVSYCDLTEQSSSFVLTVYNPQGHNVRSHVRVPVTGIPLAYSVSGPDGSPVASQLVPVPQPVLDDPERKGTATTDLVFNVDLPSSGFNTYFVQSTGTVSSASHSVAHKLQMPTADATIQNEFVSVTVDGTTGLLRSITDLVAGKTYNVGQNFYYYQGMAGDNSQSDRRASGAYIFRPNGTTHALAPTATVTLVTGTEVQEIQQTFNSWVSQVIRLYPGENKVELEWMVGPIPVDDGIGKEIITLYSTDLANQGIYYTDSNGREVLQRIRNYRPTWNVQLLESISGNYYPINSRIYIQDSAQDSQLTVITDRSEGGGSIIDGTVEVMLHRRLLYDDSLGVGEALNEPGVDGKGLRVRGKHWLQVSSIASAGKLQRVAGLEPSNSPLVFIAPLLTTIPNYITQFKTTFTALTAPLPDNVNLLTVEPWIDGTVLLRFEHFLEKTDDPSGLSNPVTFNIQNLFAGLQITSITETTLGANTWLSDLNRLVWNTGSSVVQEDRSNEVGGPLDVTLNPMQIRTFVAKVAYV